MTFVMTHRCWTTPVGYFRPDRCDAFQSFVLCLQDCSKLLWFSNNLLELHVCTDSFGLFVRLLDHMLQAKDLITLDDEREFEEHMVRYIFSLSSRVDDLIGMVFGDIWTDWSVVKSFLSLGGD